VTSVSMEIFDFIKRRGKVIEKLDKKHDSMNLAEFRFIVPEPTNNVINPHLVPKDIYVPRGKGELSEVTQHIWTYAPDEYDCPYGSTMETDFEELRRGIDYVFRQKRFNETRPQIMNLVEEAYEAYKLGDQNKGMDLISQIQIMQGKMK